MPLPRRVQIGPVAYTVEEDRRITDAAGCWGRIDYAPQIIALDPDQQPDHRAVTLLHEVLHGCWHHAHLNGFEGNEESMVSALAPLLLDTLRRNPELVAFLTDEREEDR